MAESKNSRYQKRRNSIAKSNENEVSTFTESFSMLNKDEESQLKKIFDKQKDSFLLHERVMCNFKEYLFYDVNFFNF